MLDKFLKKIGVTSFSELNDEEKKTFREWEFALSGRKLTDDDVQNWLNEEYETAVTRATDEGLTEKVRDFRSAEVRIIKRIISFINSPKVEKVMAEQAIKQLID